MLRSRMNLSRLRAAVEAAARVCESPEVIVVGTGALYASIKDQRLRAARLPSRVDVFIPVISEYNYNGEQLRRELGQSSRFHTRERVAVRPVYVEQLRLPSGWSERLVAHPVGGATGLCADPHDVCASLLAEQVPGAAALIERLSKMELLDPAVLRRRVQLMNLHDMQPVAREGHLPAALSLAQAGELAQRLQRYTTGLLPAARR